MDYRSGMRAEAHKIFALVWNHGMHYDPLLHQQTILHLSCSYIRDPILGTLTYGGNPQIVDTHRGLEI